MWYLIAVVGLIALCVIMELISKRQEHKSGTCIKCGAILDKKCHVYTEKGKTGPFCSSCAFHITNTSRYMIFTADNK